MFRNPQGYSYIVSPDAARVVFDRFRAEEIPAGTTERDTFTCFHCNRVKHVKPRERPEDTGGLCKCCMKLICAKCVAAGNCVPFEKKLEAAEARDRALRSYGM